MKNCKILLAVAGLFMSASSFAQQSYDRVSLSFTPTTFKTSMNNQSSKSDKIDGLTVDYVHGLNILPNAPLYVEFGAGLAYNNSNESTKAYFDGIEIFHAEADVSFLSAKVPVNLVYRVPLTKGISLAPYAGLQAKINLIGKATNENGIAGQSSKTSVSFFDYDAKRFQLGYQVGVGLNIKMVYVGVGYQGDMTSYLEEAKGEGLVVTLGYNF